MSLVSRSLVRFRLDGYFYSEKEKELRRQNKDPKEFRYRAITFTSEGVFFLVLHPVGHMAIDSGRV